MIELDELLNGQPTTEQITEYLKDDGEFYGEQYLVQFIKKYCRDEEDRQIFARLDVSIEEALNGRYSIEYHSEVNRIFTKWNKKIGYDYFGS